MTLYDLPQEVKDELDEYADMEGTEVGEACKCLLALANYPDYVSEKFGGMLVKEIQAQLTMFKRRTKIVERTETLTSTYKELNWL